MEQVDRTATAAPVNSLSSPVPQAAHDDIGPTFPRLSFALLWGFCLFPLLLFAAFAVYQRDEALREGERAVARTIQILEEHALRVFEAQQLIMDQTDQYLADLSWDDIRMSEEVHRFLRQTAMASPHVDGLWLVPPDGRTANSADFFPFPDLSVTDRRYFQTLRARDELHYGEMIVGRVKGNFNFNLSRRRSPREDFNGVILVTSSIDYFTEFWEQASQGSFAAGIFRDDGEILVRYPHLETLPKNLSEDSPTFERMRTIDDAVYPSVSSLDGQARIYGYSRIGGTPLFIGYGVPNAQVLANWRSEMQRMGFIAVMATVLLAIAASAITRQSRRLGATAASWRHTAQNLEREVTRRVRAEDVAAERKRLLDEVRALTAQRQSILENMAEGVIALDARGCITYANPEATKLLGPLREGDQEFASLVALRRILAADGSDLDPALAPERAPLRGDDLPETEYLVRNQMGQHAACFFRGGSILGSDGRPEGAVLTFWDVTERKREAERRDLLMRELDHRVRNMLATIMAMIRISNEPRQTKDEFVTALSARVGAMTRTHGVLSEGRWEGATMGRIVDDEVRSASKARQLVLKGDRDVMLPPKEAADLVLALHELATNATKHGAWSVPEGQVMLRWEVLASSDGHELRVEWKESGGPTVVAPPERRGFGTNLLQGVFAGVGGVSLDYEPDGLRCMMRVALHERRNALAIVEAPPADAAPDAKPASIVGLRVLVVEDEAVVRLDLVELLRELGATVVAEAGTLVDGLEKAGSLDLDAAVLDRNLNGESGLPIAQILEKRGIPLVFVSGYSAPGQRQAQEKEEHIHLLIEGRLGGFNVVKMPKRWWQAEGQSPPPSRSRAHWRGQSGPCGAFVPGYM
jgi:PAS domain S-box-containing protein